MPDLTMPQAVVISVGIICWVVFVIARALGER